MNYIYDIILNFNEQIYDFYEWNKSDNLTHIRKIPFFKVSSIDMYNFEHYSIILSEAFLDQIKNRTEIFSGKSIKNIEYACLFSDGINVLAIKIKNNYYYSKLLLDEEEEVVDVVGKMKEVVINYKISKEKNNVVFKTRKEIEIENYVKKELKKLEINKEYEKLKYLYFECFGKEEIDIKAFLDVSSFMKAYNLLKLIEIKK